MTCLGATIFLQGVDIMVSSLPKIYSLGRE